MINNDTVICFWPRDVRHVQRTALEEQFLKAWMASPEKPFKFEGYTFEVAGLIPYIKHVTSGLCLLPRVFDKGLGLAQVKVTQHMAKRSRHRPLTVATYKGRNAQSTVSEVRKFPDSGSYFTLITVGKDLDSVADLHRKVRRGEASPSG